MKKIILNLLAGIVLLSGCSGMSKELKVPAARAGLAAPADLACWSRGGIDAYMRYSVWRGSKSGFIALFARDSVPVYSNVAGWKDIAAGTPMTRDTPVRIASMTKPITAVAAMILVEEGKLGLEDPVSDYLPEFAPLRVANSEVPKADGSFTSVPASTPLTVKHLLTFTSGLGPGRENNSPLKKYWDSHGLYEQPGGDLGDRVTALT